MPDNLSKIDLFTRLGTAEGQLIKTVTLTVGHAALDGKDANTAADIAAGNSTAGLILGGTIETKTPFTKAGPAAMDNDVRLTVVDVGGVDILTGATHNVEAAATTAFSVMRQLDAGAVTVTMNTGGGDNLSLATAGELEIKLFIAVPS